MAEVIHFDWFDIEMARLRRLEARQDERLRALERQVRQVARERGLVWHDGRWREAGLRLVKS